MSRETEEADAFMAQGNAALKQGDRTAAREAFQAAMELRRQTLGEAHLDVADCLNALSCVSKYPANRNYLEQALGIQRMALGNVHTAVASTLNMLGTCCCFEGDFAATRDYFKQSLDIVRVTLGDTHPTVAASLLNLGTIYYLLGDYPAARDYYERALAITGAALGEVHHDNLAGSLEALGHVCHVLDDYAAARDYYEQALAIRRAARGEAHLHVADSLNHLGDIHFSLGDYAAARGYYEQALSIQRQALDQCHPVTSHSLHGLANLNRNEGFFDQAAAQLEEVLRITLLNDNFFGLPSVYAALSKLQAARGATESAIFFGKQAVNAIQHQRGRLTTLEPELQRSFLVTKEAAYQDLATLLVSAGRLGEAQQVLAMLKEEELFDLLRRDTADDPRLTFAQLTTLEATWQSHGNTVGQDLVRLTAEIAALEQKDALNPGEETRLGAARHELDLAAQAFHAWLTELSTALTESADRQAHSAAINLDQLETLQGVLDDLGSNVALVSYIVGKEKLSIILTTVAFQVSRDVAVTEKVINKLVLEFREAIAQCAENDTRTFGKVLWRHLIGPIAPILHEASIKTLMIAPYGTLRYVPFAALHDGEAYVIERFALSFVTLAAFTNLRDKPHDQWSVAGLGVSRAVPNYRLLIAVPEELHGIVRAKAEGTGVYPGIVHLDEAFTEGSFASSLKAHQVVHVASHFKLNPAQGLRSHLLLGDGKELTLERMNDVSFNFRKIELMTLSACETAVGGAKQNGSEFEGFGALVQKRGAKAVVASLWPVEDGGTALLMQLFYKGKHEGLSKAAALQKAQITFLTTPKPQPYYWAAFILMGNWL